MSIVYTVSFAIGIIYAIVSSFGIFDFDVDADFEGDFPILSPIIIASFLTVFGGLGLLLDYQSTMSSLGVALIAVVAAIVIAILLFFLVVLPMAKAERSTAYSEKEMIGQLAEVITPITKGGHGEIIYTQGGSRLSGPATSHEDKRIDSGDIVEITDVAGGMFIVRKKK